MGDVLVYCEVLDGRATSGAGRLLTFARPLAEARGGAVVALVAGDICGMGDGLEVADVVVEAVAESLAVYVPQAHAAVLVAAIADRRPDIVLLENTTIGIDLAAATAGATGLPLVSYCLELAVEGDEVRSQSAIYGGQLQAEIRTQLPAVFAVTSGALPEPGSAAGRGDRVQLDLSTTLGSTRARFIEAVAPEDTGIDITIVDRIVCVGRGIGSADNVSVGEELAAALGGELAASRPVVDAGWVSKARQVGKSGVTVKPKLYFALGVSGAPEHLEGMRGAELIIAVNSDPEASIFDVAHYGAVADLFDVAEQVTKLVRGGA